LGVKGGAVYTISPDKTLGDVVRELVDHRVGALLVRQTDETGAERLLGIITERDLLLAHAGRKRPATTPEAATGACPLMSCKVSEIMSADLVTGSPTDSVEQVMGLMTTRRIRHLPVLADGRLIGMISIGDVVKAQHDQLAMENRYMKDYIRG
jgi:CBS domain-containing protein